MSGEIKQLPVAFNLGDKVTIHGTVKYIVAGDGEIKYTVELANGEMTEVLAEEVSP